MTMLMSLSQGPTTLVALNIFSVALLFATARLIKGPTVADRVIALDLITTLLVGFIATYAVWTNQPMLLRVAIVVALIAFLGTVAFAMLVERRGRQ